MTNEVPMHVEVNATTGEVTERPLTQAELDKMETDRIAFAEKEAERLAQIEAREALKVSAKAKLIAGEPLTEEEAATIVL